MSVAITLRRDFSASQLSGLAKKRSYGEWIATDALAE
jgi:hypothetical protein